MLWGSFEGSKDGKASRVSLCSFRWIRGSEGPTAWEVRLCGVGVVFVEEVVLSFTFWTFASQGGSHFVCLERFREFYIVEAQAL